MLATGADKAAALDAVLKGPYDPMRWPAQIGARDINVTWFTDGADGIRMRIAWLLPLFAILPFFRTSEQPAPEPDPHAADPRR
jgi:hypothetical protein